HKVTPQPISPKQHDIASLPVFALHDRMVDAQTAREPGDALVAGHKKDVVLSTLLQEWPDRVVLYGWHRRDGTPIQPKSKAHTTPHVDYSHGIRLVARTVLLDGRPTTLDAVLADPRLCALLSDEGPLPAAARRRLAGWRRDGGRSGAASSPCGALLHRRLSARSGTSRRSRPPTACTGCCRCRSRCSG
ncbi:MAG: hypothetical protein ACK51X_00710, partial [Planctomycetota bacterium]